MKRLVWLDPADMLEVDEILSKIRESCPDHEWIRFEESSYDSSSEAQADFQRYFEGGALFGDGRVVIMRESPSFSGWVAGMLPEYSGNNVLVIVSPPDKKNAIYGLAKNKWAFLEECKPLARGDAEDWVKSRAEKLGTSIENVAARMIVDKVGPGMNQLTMELRKLSIIANPITAWAVEQVAFGSGEGDIRDFLNAIAKGDSALSHEMLDRLVAKGDWPIGAICDWLRKMVLAESCDCNLDDATRDKIAAMRKPVREDGNFKRGKDGKIATTTFFSNPRALYYSCKEAKGKPKWWAHDLMIESRDVQLKVRTLKSPLATTSLMHSFVEKLTCQRK